MNDENTIPLPSTLMTFREIHSLYEQRTGRHWTARQTVNKWLACRGIKPVETTPAGRKFNRAVVTASLVEAFPMTPQFMTVEDAFLCAGRPYPKKYN
ncbi:MAG TPA: hypothetical protein VFY06_15585 [Verrucomicrobiae bacterium]|nr:hypothetical protein [Verrucomicrobiae bacterium]